MFQKLFETNMSDYIVNLFFFLQICNLLINKLLGYFLLWVNYSQTVALLS